MKILLVRPRPEPATIGLQHLMVVEPMELEILGALARDQDEVKLVDMILERASFERIIEIERPDLLCVTGYITNVATMVEYCGTAKASSPATVTVVGGVHCEVCPEDLDHAVVDFRVVRNPVTVFPRLLAHIEDGGPLPEGVLVPDQQMDTRDLPPMDFHYVAPDRSLTASWRDRYFYVFHDRVALLKTSFGCPYTCQFCFCREITRGQYHQRPLHEVMAELQSLPEREVYIVDDDFLADARTVTSFVDEVHRRGIRKHYLVYGRADFIANNPGLMERLRDAGLRTVIVGFESFFEEELQAYGKQSDVETNRRAMRVLNRLRIECFATIILNPEWDRGHFRRLERELKELGIHFVNLQPLTPMPGTQLEASDDQLLIRRADYAQWDLAHLTLPTSRLSAADYYREILRLYRRILFQPRVLLRHLRRHRPRMLWRMVVGAQRVDAQYRRKIREAAGGAILPDGGSG